MNTLPPPNAFGLPAKFNKWRENQSEACQSILDTDRRFLIQVCPTGFGKSVTYVTAAALSEGRTAILTSTKGLQQQLVSEFGSIVADIRGRGNYKCRLNSKTTCDYGPCSLGLKCSLKIEGGCEYFDAVQTATKSKIVVTNYSYWCYQNGFSRGLGKFDRIILDEAHAAPDHVIDYLSITLRKDDILSLKSVPESVPEWVEWSRTHQHSVMEEMIDAKYRRKEKRFIRLKRTLGLLERIEDIDESWVWEDAGKFVTLSPVWPGPYTESALFLGVPRVVLTSATVVEKTARLLGIERRNTKFQEYPHSFPVKNRPLIHIPTVRMNFRNGAMEERMWLTRVDQIIRERIGEKGIIHTVSYARRDAVLAHSRYADHMITHARLDTQKRVMEFKRSSAPAILVSPSMATGWDFPDDECRWQIIVKLPYPDTRGAIMKARAKDKEFTSYLVAQQLIQATGRGVRSKTDYCETYILDNNITWYITQNKNLLVSWFTGAYRVSNTVPKGRKENYG